MKLIGSRIEQLFREELIRSNLSLRSGDNKQLAKALASAKVNVVGAYVLYWIPEQGEDIYRVLVPTSEVLTVELPRDGGPVLLEREGLASYERKCSMSGKIQIAVALDLMASGSLGSTNYNI